MVIIVLGALAGGVVGFFWYKFVGCRTGACVLTSHPLRSVLIWALIGGLFASNFWRK